MTNLLTIRSPKKETPSTVCCGKCSSDTSKPKPAPKRISWLWNLGFRPFFLGAALWAIVPALVWTGSYGQWLSSGTNMSTVTWHSHEMIFGFTIAVIFGFLLTAVPKWSGTTPLSGGKLAAIFGLWATARIAMLFAAALPAWLPPVLCVLPFAAVAMAIGIPIYAKRNRRNYFFPIGMLAFGYADSLLHLSHKAPLAKTSVLSAPHAGAHLGLYIALILIVAVGGRIIPSFTNNALVRSGKPKAIGDTPRWEAVIAPAVAIALLLPYLAGHLAPVPTFVVVGLLAFAGLLVVARAVRYKTHKVLHDPLVWVLHAGHLFVGLGLLTLAVTKANLGIFIPAAGAWHLPAIGAVGLMCLGMLSRVSLGHTNRPLVLPKGMTLAFILLLAAVLIRSFAPWFFPQGYSTIMRVGALMWSAAFVVFLVQYTKILLSAPLGADK